MWGVCGALASPPSVSPLTLSLSVGCERYISIIFYQQCVFFCETEQRHKSGKVMMCWSIDVVREAKSNVSVCGTCFQINA